MNVRSIFALMATLVMLTGLGCCSTCGTLSPPTQACRSCAVVQRPLISRVAGCNLCGLRGCGGQCGQSAGGESCGSSCGDDCGSSCESGGCESGNCATGNCATGGCATGGCASGSCGVRNWPNPFGGLLGCNSGCGPLYWSEWHNDPPAMCDPCDCHGRWTGVSQGYGEGEIVEEPTLVVTRAKASRPVQQVSYRKSAPHTTSSPRKKSTCSCGK